MRERDEVAGRAAKGGFRRGIVAAMGWLSFGLGWAGVFLPGLPTTIFWIMAALAFVRVNRKMYGRIIAHRRFGEPVRLFVEEGKISGRGKVISITAMMSCATLGALAIPPLWVKLVVVGAAVAGSVWVAVLPTPTTAERAAKVVPGQSGP